MKTRLLIFLLFISSVRGYCQSCSTISFIQSEPSICNGSAIILTAVPNGGTAPYSYSWSTGEITPAIAVNKAGTYKVTITDRTPGCIGISQSVTVNAASIPQQPLAVTPVFACSGSSANLTASGGPAGATYQWFDTLTGGNQVSGEASWTTGPVISGVTYYVQVTVNGCSSARQPVSVSITGKPSVSNPAICSGNQAYFSASGGSSYKWYASSNPSDTTVLGTGPNFLSPTPLTQSTNFFVVATTGTCVSARTPGTAYVSTPPSTPNAIVNPICAGSSANVHASGASSGAIYDWFASETSTNSLISSPDYTTPPLIQNTDYWVQVTLGSCVSTRRKVTVQVNPVPAAPAPQLPIQVCYNTGTTITVGSDPSLTYNWYDAPFGGEKIHTGGTFSSLGLTNSTSYYVDASTTTCGSGRTQIIVNVDPPLSTPQVSSPTICYNSAASLLPTSPGGTYAWFTAAGVQIATTTTAAFVTSLLTATTTYYVQTTIGNCTSVKVPVVVTVNPVIPMPVAAPVSVCIGNSAHLTATGGTRYAWYNNANDVTPALTGEYYDTPPVTANKTFYLENVDKSGCTSARQQVVVTVTAMPDTPVPVVPKIVCQGTRPTLTVSASGGGKFNWYDASGNLLPANANGDSFVPPQPLNGKTTFYVSNSNGQCTTSKVAVDVPVLIIPNPQFQYSSGSVCAGDVNPVPTVNNPYGGKFTAAPAGLKFINGATGEIDPAGSSPGYYTITFVGNDPCPHTSIASFAIITTANALFTYNSPICNNSPNLLPKLPLGGSTGTFSSAGTGLVFANTTTGEIDLRASRPGTYTVTNTISTGPCTGGDIKSSPLTITQGVIVKADPNPTETIAVGSTFALNGNITGAISTGKWSAGSGSFSNSTSLNAVYTPAAGIASVVITLTSDNPPGTCGPQSDSFILYNNDLTIVNPIASALPVCAGSTGSLSATSPGGNYQWFDVASGGTALGGGANFTTPKPLLKTTNFYVSTTINSVTSGRTPVTVIVNDMPATPDCKPQTVCSGSVATLTATDLTGSYEWYDSQNGGSKISTTNPFTTQNLSASVTFYVQRVANGCVSVRLPVLITVDPVPVVNSAATDYTCSGAANPYTATANLPGTTFTWSRDVTAGISNPAATSSSAIINEALISTSLDIVTVVYVIIPHLNQCDGMPFNYTLKVYPNPQVIEQQQMPICSGSSPNYSISFNVQGVGFNWSRAAVTGISNAPVSGQSASTLKEVLFNTTEQKITVTYIYNFFTNSCNGNPYTYSVVVNPEPRVSVSKPALQACSGFSQNINLTSNMPNATFFYGRDAAQGITQNAVRLVEAKNGIIDEVLDNTTTRAINIVYNIVASAGGCTGTALGYTVTINPLPVKPIANSNSPVCVGSTINLTTTAIAGATYLWTGPNGFTSSEQNPSISNVTAANSGDYKVVVISAQQCQSLQSALVPVMVNPPPHITVVKTANACTANNFVLLSAIGSTGTGIWLTEGTGTFSSVTNLDTKYFPSAADKAAGSVTVRLASTSKDNCIPAYGDILIRFVKQPAVKVSKDTLLCSQITAFTARGSVSIPGGIRWTTSGTGTFSNASLPVTTYYPSAADIKNVQVTLTLTALAPSECDDPYASFNLNFVPPPTAYAGGTRYVLYGNTITLNPIVNEEKATYLWSPNFNIDDPTAKNPVITGALDTTYMLTVTDARGCVVQDRVKIKVSPLIVAPNTFTPNADGVNDRWEISGLIAYQNATVDIFTRNGQNVFHSMGYPIPWDGTNNGKQLPVGVYYYMIASKFKGQLLSGWVTIIR